MKMHQVAEAVAAATGWDTRLWEIMKLGERTVTLKRCVSVRQGASRKDDRLPSGSSNPRRRPAQGPRPGSGRI